MIPRRNHISETINDYMMIFGGIDEFDNFLNDFWVLDLFYLKWIKMDTKGQKPSPLAYMCSSIVISIEKRNNPNFNIFKPMEHPPRSHSKVNYNL